MILGHILSRMFSLLVENIHTLTICMYNYNTIMLSISFAFFRGGYMCLALVELGRPHPAMVSALLKVKVLLMHKLIGGLHAVLLLFLSFLFKISYTVVHISML